VTRREDGVVWQSDLFSQPRARRDDPETSHEAAGSVRRISETQEAILSILEAQGPLTDDRIARYYNWHPEQYPRCSPSGLRTRRSELQKAGKVEDSGVRVRMESGRNAIVWRRK
jgi:hypothetical protein